MFFRPGARAHLYGEKSQMFRVSPLPEVSLGGIGLNALASLPATEARLQLQLFIGYLCLILTVEKYIILKMRD